MLDKTVSSMKVFTALAIILCFIMIQQMSVEIFFQAKSLLADITGEDSRLVVHVDPLLMRSLQCLTIIGGSVIYMVESLSE